MQLDAVQLDNNIYAKISQLRYSHNHATKVEEGRGIGLT